MWAPVALLPAVLHFLHCMVTHRVVTGCLAGAMHGDVQTQATVGWQCVTPCAGAAMQVGTAVVTRQDKRLAVGRLGALVEQIEALVSKDLQVILVSRTARHCLSYSHPRGKLGTRTMHRYLSFAVDMHVPPCMRLLDSLSRKSNRPPSLTS